MCIFIWWIKQTVSIQFCNHYLLTSVYFSLKKHIYLLGTLTISLKLSLSIFTFTSYFSLFLFCQRSPKIRKQHYWRYIPLLGDHNLTPYNHSKNRPVWRDVDYHKRLECLPHRQLVWKWNGTAHNSTNDIRAKVMGSSYGSVIVREGLLGGTIIWLPTTTLKISLLGVMSNTIKDLSVSFSSQIGFEVEWH